MMLEVAKAWSTSTWVSSCIATFTIAGPRCLQPNGSMRTAVTSQKPCLCLTIPVVRCSFDQAACAIQLETPDFVPAFQLHVGDLTMSITSPDIIQANSFVIVSRTSSLRTAKVLMRDSDDDSRPKTQECHNRGFGHSTQAGAVWITLGSVLLKY